MRFCGPIVFPPYPTINNQQALFYHESSSFTQYEFPSYLFYGSTCSLLFFRKRLVQSKALYGAWELFGVGFIGIDKVCLWCLID